MLTKIKSNRVLWTPAEYGNLITFIILIISVIVITITIVIIIIMIIIIIIIIIGSFFPCGEQGLESFPSSVIVFIHSLSLHPVVKPQQFASFPLPLLHLPSGAYFSQSWFTHTQNSAILTVRNLILIILDRFTSTFQEQTHSYLFFNSHLFKR